MVVDSRRGGRVPVERADPDADAAARQRQQQSFPPSASLKSPQQGGRTGGAAIGLDCIANLVRAADHVDQYHDNPVPVWHVLRRNMP